MSRLGKIRMGYFGETYKLLPVEDGRFGEILPGVCRYSRTTEELGETCSYSINIRVKDCFNHQMLEKARKEKIQGKVIQSANEIRCLGPNLELFETSDGKYLQINSGIYYLGEEERVLGQMASILESISYKDYVIHNVGNSEIVPVKKARKAK